MTALNEKALELAWCELNEDHENPPRVAQVILREDLERAITAYLSAQPEQARTEEMEKPRFFASRVAPSPAPVETSAPADEAEVVKALIGFSYSLSGEEEEIVDDVLALIRAQSATIAQLRERNRKLRDVLNWTEEQCPGKCAGVCRDALIADAALPESAALPKKEVG